MAFRERQRANAVTIKAKYRAKEKYQAHDGYGSKGSNKIREGIGIDIERSREKKAAKDVSEKAKEKKVDVEDGKVKEEVREDEEALEVTEKAAAVAVAVE